MIFIVNVYIPDNSTLENLLPGVVDGALGIILGLQGPDRQASDTDAAVLSDLPGQFTLIYDEGTGFEYGK